MQSFKLTTFFTTAILLLQFTIAAPAPAPAAAPVPVPDQAAYDSCVNGCMAVYTAIQALVGQTAAENSLNECVNSVSTISCRLMKHADFEG
jgi:hypothetical protein